MIRINFLVFFLTISSFSFCQDSKKEQKAYELAIKAIDLMNEGNFKEAIKLLEKAQKLDPDRIDYPYEIAYALYSNEKYANAIGVLESLKDHPDVTELIFQLLGNAYDNTGKPDKAIEIYKQGLKSFPNSGRLYLEQGIVEYYREKYDNAIDYWEKGVEVDPTFSSNYYWLGKIFSYTEERIWSILYGEIFINLERNSDRTVEMSKILFDTYKESIYINSDTSGGVRFSKVMTVDPKKKFKIPFQIAFGLTMTMSLAINIIYEDQEISIGTINTIRQNFISNWYNQKRNKDYPNLLFDFQKLLKEKGFFDAYNYRFLMKGNEEEFAEWYNNNESIFNEFADWYNEIPLKITSKNYFSRLKY